MRDRYIIPRETLFSPAIYFTLRDSAWCYQHNERWRRGIHFLQVGSTTPIVFTSIYCSRENPKERCPCVISLLEAQYAAGVSSHRAAEVVAQSVAREISKILKIHLKTTSEDINLLSR